MRKAILISVLIGLLCMIVGCSSRTEKNLHKITGLSEEQCQHIEGVLAEFGFSYQTVSVSNNQLLKGMDGSYKGFDLLGLSGEIYLLIARKDGEDFVAILNNNNELIEGIIEYGVLPNWFK